MALDLYADEIASDRAKLQSIKDVEPGIFANYFSGTGQATMRGFAETARAASMALAPAAIAEDAYHGSSVAKDRFFKWHDEVFGRAVDFWTPRPNEVGVAGEVTGKLLSMLPLIMAGPAGQALAVGGQTLTTAEDLARKHTDVSAGQAVTVGMLQGAGLATGIWMPILGQNLVQRVLIGGVGFNVVQGVATRAASGLVLSGTKAEKDFEAFDGKALTLDVLLGMAFGGIAHFVPAQRAAGAEAWAKINDWAKSLKPSDIDALLVLREAQHINEDSLPGRPATPADASAHVDRVRQAIDQLASDRPVNVEDIKVPRGTLPPNSDIVSKQIVTVDGKESTRITYRDGTIVVDGETITAKGETLAPEINRDASWEQLAVRKYGQERFDQALAEETANVMGGTPAQRANDRELVGQKLMLEPLNLNLSGQVRDPRFEVDASRLQAAEQQVADLQTAAQRVRTEEGLPRVEEQRTTPPRDITPLDPIAQSKAVGQWISRKLMDTGMSRLEADTNGLIWEARAKSVYDTYGVPPSELMAMYGVDVRRMDSADKLLGALEQRRQPMKTLIDAIGHDDAAGLVANWNDSELSKAGKITSYVGRERNTARDEFNGKMQTPQDDFVRWLFSDEPLSSRYDGSPEWVAQVTRAREALKDFAPARGTFDPNNPNIMFQGVDEYGGQHRPPGPGSGAPAHDLTGGGAIYPDDIYGPNAARFYGHGEDALDRQTIAILQSLKGKPDAKVTIYRAVPDDITVADRLAKLEKQMAAYMRRGTVPDGETAAGWYDRASAERDRLQALPEESSGEKARINEGDWVTVNRNYAKQHAEGALKGSARIISKSVKASEIFTNGDSIHEFGYWPKGSAPETLYQEPFYSQLSRQVEGLKTTSAPAKGWKDTIKGLVSKGQVKQAEIEATGLNEWLELQTGKVTKQQVQDYLTQNGVKVEEVELGKPVGWDVFDPRDGRAIETFETSQEAANWVAENSVRGGIQYDYARADDTGTSTSVVTGDTKFSQYQLPGGENYRELLLTLPPKKTVTDDFVTIMPDGTPHGVFATEAEAKRVAKEIGGTYEGGQSIGKEAAKFRSSHYPDVDNLLAHVRYNERTDAEGKKVLFIEEIQSDWAQKGKKEGFTNGQPAPTPREISVAQNEALAALRGEDNLGYDTPGQAANALYADYRTEGAAVFNRYEMSAESRAALQNWFDIEGRVAQKGVPSAPFVAKTEAWVALSLKRMIRYAAENGFDRVAWTTGEQQAARYDLSKQVNKIEWSPVITSDGGNGQHIIIDTPSGLARINVDKDGRIVSTPNPGIFRGQEPIGKHLSDVVGKEIADKIAGSYKGELEGEGLRIGGEGMKAFYDKIVPNIANDVLKKMGGGRVGEVPINNMGERYRVEPIEQVNMFRVVDYGENSRGSGVFVTPPLRHDAATAWVAERQPSGKQYGFDVTPGLREKAMAGVPLFQGGARGSATSFSQTGQSLIHLFENADKSTFQHETGHVFLEMTRDLANRPDVPMAAVQDWATLSNWLGLEGGPITREAHEKFARGWEKYLAEGVAPNEGLKGAFKRFRDWMIDIYKSLTNMDVELNNQVRGVMARMLESQAKDPISKGGLEDPRLQTKEYRDALDMMGREAGWAEEGGRIIRDPLTGEVTDRTQWIAHAEWFQRMQQNEKTALYRDRAAGLDGARKGVEDAIRKAVMGEPMTVQEKRAVTWMLDEHAMVMKHWEEEAAALHPDGDPFEIANLQHAEGIEPTRQNTLDMALIERARQVDPEALENIPTNSDDAQFMAAVREIVNAHKPAPQETNQGGEEATAQTEHVGPQPAASGSPPPPGGESAGGAAAPNMVAREARTIAAENPDVKVRVGTEADGTPMYKSLNDMLDEAELDARIAMEDVNLIAVAAECLMGVA